MNTDQFWKPRATLNIAAAIALALAAVELWRALDGKHRKAVVGACVLFGTGLALFFLAGTVEQWCAPPGSSFGENGGLTWGEHPFHAPTLRDCLSVRR